VAEFAKWSLALEWPATYNAEEFQRPPLHYPIHGLATEWMINSGVVFGQRWIGSMEADQIKMKRCYKCHRCQAFGYLACSCKEAWRCWECGESMIDGTVHRAQRLSCINLIKFMRLRPIFKALSGLVLRDLWRLLLRGFQRNPGYNILQPPLKIKATTAYSLGFTASRSERVFASSIFGARLNFWRINEYA
jgi:hypothetical protein